MKRTPLRKVSKRRQAQLRTYAKVRKALLAEHHACQICTDIPSRLDIHHMAGRNGDALNDRANLLVVCRACHDSIHRHPATARRLGWLK